MLGDKLNVNAMGCLTKVGALEIESGMKGRKTHLFVFYLSGTANMKNIRISQIHLFSSHVTFNPNLDINLQLSFGHYPKFTL